jgi:molybdate transport system substrate-binding protein
VTGFFPAVYPARRLWVNRSRLRWIRRLLTRAVRMYSHRSLTAVLMLATLLSAGSTRGERVPIVAAASDVSFALTEARDRFASQEGTRLELVFGSSGTLTRQIQDGAPFELFLSADEGFVNQLVVGGFTRDRGELYGIGRIVLFAPAGSPLLVDERLEGLAQMLRKGQVRRFAIANPEHAPYGRAAEAVLRKRGLWDALRPHLVLGDNVSQAAQFATTGSAVGGIIAQSLVLAPTLKDRGQYALIPQFDHPPLRQRMVLLKRAGPVAERFFRYLQGPEARAILERYGFGLPPQR